MVIDPLAEYAILLFDLKIMISEFGHDSKEADAVRDLMDAPWRLMSGKEMETARRISGGINGYRVTVTLKKEPQVDAKQEEALDECLGI